MSFIANTNYQPGDSEEIVIKKIAQSCGLDGNGGSFQCLVKILQAIQATNSGNGSNVIFSNPDGTIGTT
jgi:hypothetical protein